jgi:predicted O-methyltransferase YrrM
MTDTHKKRKRNDNHNDNDSDKNDDSMQRIQEVEDLLSVLTHLEDLNRKLASCVISEGHAGQVVRQVADLSQLVKGHKRILEIGFNAGHSAVTFLASTDTDVTVTSVDLGEHMQTVPVAKEFIDQTFPNRHTLVLGDSRKVLSEEWVEKPESLVKGTFDFVFIDGGHAYDVALADFHHCFNHWWDKKALQRTLAMDDIWFHDGPENFTTGPTTVWREQVLRPFSDPESELSREEYATHYRLYREARGMAWLQKK